MNVIQCYAPTNDSDEENKDQFYNRLQTIIDKCPVKDVNILMGDFNAKIGKDNTGYEEVMGKHGLGEINENGERFAETCALNKIVIGGSIFPHKSYLGITRSRDREPDRPHLHRQDIQKVPSGRESEERSRCCV